MSRIHLRATKDLNCSCVNCCIEFNVYLHKNDFMNVVKTFIIQFTQEWFYEQTIHRIAIIYIVVFMNHLLSSCLIHRMVLHQKCTENPSAMFHERGPWMMFSGCLMQCSWKQKYSSPQNPYSFCFFVTCTVLLILE